MSNLVRITSGEFVGFFHPDPITDTQTRLLEIQRAIMNWYDGVKLLYGYDSRDKIMGCKQFRYWTSEAHKIGYVTVVQNDEKTGKLYICIQDEKSSQIIPLI